MSRRGIIPIIVASSIGIINGVWVFKPAFSERKQMESSTDLRNDPVYVPNDNGQDDTSSSPPSLTQNTQESSIVQPVNQTRGSWSSIFTDWSFKKK